MKWTAIGILLASLVAVGFSKIRIKSPIKDGGLSELHPLSDAMIDNINHNLKPLWKAGRNFDVNTSMTYIRKLMGALEEPSYMRLPRRRPHRANGLHVPKEFDARQKWPNCPSLNEIRDQGSCGSCWAFSVTETMTDRYCIASKGKQFRFSAENLMTCCGLFNLCGFGCNGGFPSMAWRYWRKKGIVSGGPYGSKEGCQPYEIEPCEHYQIGERRNCTDTLPYPTPACKKVCEPSYPISYNDDLHFGRDAYSVSTVGRDTEQVQIEIMKNGPVGAVLGIYGDFLSYKSGIYHYTSGIQLGGHAVKIIGWGEENGVQYWTVANSWNYDFGEKGFFRIRRGHNECGIERFISAGLPAV